uniref:Uncharacterized protein n=1 Tax=Arundo donax TaxID=35708 RepID=A0A0A9A750_ARUDO
MACTLQLHCSFRPAS